MSFQHVNDDKTKDSEGANGKAFQPADHLGGIEPPLPSFAESQTQQSMQYRPPQPVPASSSAYPIQPHHTSVAARTFRIKYTDWIDNNILVFENSESAPQYQAHCKMAKPHLTFTTFREGAAIGTSSFHTLSTRIDIVIGGIPIVLTTKGLLRDKYTFDSVAQAGLTFTWRCRKTSSELLCEDQSRIQVTRLKYSIVNYCKGGCIEIFNQRAASGRALDEIVVSGVALAHMILVMTLAGISAAVV